MLTTSNVVNLYTNLTSYATSGLPAASLNAGVIVYNTTANEIWYSDGTSWGPLTGQVHENILPNTQWKIATAIGNNTKMNPEGTGTQSPITVSAYTTGANTVVCTTTDTKQLKVGDLVTFSAAADTNLKVCSSRVESLVANTSFTIKLPLNYTASSSAACTAIPWDAGGSSSVGTGDAFDGWSKGANATVWRDDFTSTNGKAGSKYSCGFLKSTSAAEQLYHTVPTKDLEKYQGKSITFGCWVYQKVKGGSGTWRLFINRGGYATVYSSSASGSGYQWLELTTILASDVTSLDIGIEFLGNSSDCYFVSQPIAGRGSRIGQGNYISPYNEVLIPKVKFTPITYNGASVTFPGTLDASGSTYGFALRFYPETNGAVADTTKAIMLQLEGQNAATGLLRLIALRNQESAPHIFAVLNYSLAAGITTSGAGWVTPGSSNADAWLYTGKVSDAWTLVSIDINGYLL